MRHQTLFNPLNPLFGFISLQKQFMQRRMSEDAIQLIDKFIFIIKAY